MLLKLGNKTQQRRIKSILKKTPGKLEALRRLTSGIPRTLILLFEIFLDKNGTAMQTMEQLLDRVTPLYKHRLDDLPSQQQAIVQEITLGWDAMSAREVAQKTRLDSKKVSAQLQQLEKNRMIRKIPTSTKNHLYQLEERFFNIWCLMRLGRPGDKRRAAWLVKFLEIWCDDNELTNRTKEHIKAMKQGRLKPQASLLLTQALSEKLLDTGLQHELLSTAATLLPPDIAKTLPISDITAYQHATEAYKKGDHDNALKLLRPLAEKGDPSAMFNLALLLEEQGKPEEAERFYRLAAEQGHTNAMNNLAVFLNIQNKLEEASTIVQNAINQNPDDLSYQTFLGLIELERENYVFAFSLIDAVFKKPNVEKFLNENQQNSLFILLAANGQTALALKLFEHEDYRHNNLKDRLKPMYYALLLEAGESRRYQALRMGPELEQTVDEIRNNIDQSRKKAAPVPDE